MARKSKDTKADPSPTPQHPVPHGKPSALVDTCVICCGDNLEQLRKLPDGCVDLIYIDAPFNSNRNYEVFWGETKETRAFEDRHASTQAYIEFMRPRCVGREKQRSYKWATRFLTWRVMSSSKQLSR
jgi:hypothetical protein